MSDNLDAAELAGCVIGLPLLIAACCVAFIWVFVLPVVGLLWLFGALS